MPELRPVFSVVAARDKILEAALSAFADVGFHGATFRIIAERAGVSQGLIVHYFKDKESLWALVGERISEDFLHFVSSTLSPDVIDGETIPRILAAYMSYWKTHPSALRLQLWRVLGAPEAERRARVERLNRHFVPIFLAAQDAGYVRSDIPAGQAMVTAGSLIQYRLHSHIEMDDAIAVTGASSPEDETFLRYVHDLIASPADQG